MGPAPSLPQIHPRTGRWRGCGAACQAPAFGRDLGRWCGPTGQSARGIEARAPSRPGVRPARAAPDGPAVTIQCKEAKAARSGAIAVLTTGRPG